MNYFRATRRFAAFVIATVVMYAAWWVSSFFIPNKQLWRQFAFKVWTTVFAKLVRLTIEVRGTPPKPPFFLVTNHLGYVDIPVLRLTVDGVFVAKSEIRNWFFAGRIVRDMGMVFIDRSRRMDIPRAGEEIIERLSGHEGVVLFPEGTSTKGEEVLEFKSSFLEFAARSDVPVYYAAITYRTPYGEPPASQSVCWWDDTGFLMHFWRMFSLSGFTAVVTFGDEPVTNTDRKALANELHARVSRLFVPVI
jgi:1-acyl-sn-glycerol-3-phosphate acyltransferase